MCALGSSVVKKCCLVESPGGKAGFCVAFVPFDCCKVEAGDKKGCPSTKGNTRYKTRGQDLRIAKKFLNCFRIEF